MTRAGSSKVSAKSKDKTLVEQEKQLMVSKAKPEKSSKFCAATTKECATAEQKSVEMPQIEQAEGSKAKKWRDEIDEIFSSRKEVKKVEKEQAKKKNKKRMRSSKESGSAAHSSCPKKRTAEGFSIYTEEELGINRRDGGDTPLCPFDCSCCF